MKILSIGHIPTWAGGLQESGLANVIYQLAKHESEIQDVEITLAATDVSVPQINDGRLKILGWTNAILLSYCVMHPIRTLKNLLQLRKLKHRYPICESNARLFLKRVFFERSINLVRPKIVHLHGPNAVWYLPIVPVECKIALTFHGMAGVDTNIQQHELLWKMEHDLFHSPKVDQVFFICTQLVEQFIEAYGDNRKQNKVIFNSYDKTHFFCESDNNTELRSSHGSLQSHLNVLHNDR